MCNVYARCVTPYQQPYLGRPTLYKIHHKTVKNGRSCWECSDSICGLAAKVLFNTHRQSAFAEAFPYASLGKRPIFCRWSMPQPRLIIISETLVYLLMAMRLGGNVLAVSVQTVQVLRALKQLLKYKLCWDFEPCSSGPQVSTVLLHTLHLLEKYALQRLIQFISYYMCTLVWLINTAKIPLQIL